MRSLAGVLVVLLAFALSACGHKALPRGWMVSQSKHVSVYTDAWIEHEYMQEWLELSHMAYAALFPGVNTGTVDAVWLKSHGNRLYSPLDDPAAGWTLERMPTGSGPIGRNGLIVLERREELGPSGPRSVRDEGLAKSQMAHLFIMKAVPMAPLWLQVGLARYMARYRMHYKGDKWMVCFGSMVFDEPIRAAQGRGTSSGRRVTISVDELFRGGWYDYDWRRRYWFEYTAYALVHYLIHGERGFNKTRFPILIEAFREGKSTEEALGLAYPHVLADEWDARVETHTHPRVGDAMLAENPNLAQGWCMPTPSGRAAEEKPRRTPADARAVGVMLDDLDRVDPFHRHAQWMPQDVVEAEALKRPRRQRPYEPPTPPGAPASDDPGTVPTVRTPASPP